jgi:predicted TIM-barrel fold metal-dependent hydrolase
MNDLRIVDCHHHLWNLDENYYPWLTDKVHERVCGEYSAIRRNYLLEDFWRDAAKVNLVKSVHVQGEHDYSDPVRETRWLQGVADELGSEGFPHGIVAYADLAADDVEQVLEGHCQYPNIRGIRQMVHAGWMDPANPKPTPLDDPVWRMNVGLLPEYGLSFDLQVYYQQMQQAAALVDDHPEVAFVLTHNGQPAQRDEAGLEGWRRGMRLLAERDNVYVKISGVGMFDRRWTVNSIRPFVLHTIETFGPARCMFASNFPVDGMMSSYARLWRAYSEITNEFSADESEAMFAGNAEKVYRV